VGLGLGRGSGKSRIDAKGDKVRGIGSSYYNVLTRHFGAVGQVPIIPLNRSYPTVMTLLRTRLRTARECNTALPARRNQVLAKVEQRREISLDQHEQLPARTARGS
jgi:hypothetical protein